VELGLDPSKGIIGSASQVYIHYGYNPDDYISMTSKAFVKK